MGMAAALKLYSVLDNVSSILAIELLTACRGLDLLTPLRTGHLARRAQTLVRRAAPIRQGDQPLSGAIAAVAKLVSAGAISSILGASQAEAL